MKLKITIKGRVHDVGYRPFLLGLAESLEIERFFADNFTVDGVQIVEILVDDADDKVELFAELVKKKKPDNAEVESIDVEEYSGRVMKIESYYRYLTAMQLAKIATYGWKMLEKQDETIKEIREVKETIREESEKTRNVVKEESEKTRKELGERIDMIRFDLKDYIESNLKDIQTKILKIEEALRKAGIM
jgi:acylphosphatase